MSYDKRKENRRKKRNFRIIVISFIFLYLIFRSVPSLLANNAKTALPEVGILTEKLPAQGFVIKTETVVRATSNGEIDLLPHEGVRVSAGTEIANINILNDHSSLKQELEQIERSIIALKKSEIDTEIIIKGKGKIEDLQDSTVDDLQYMISLGKFDEVYLLKEKLSLYDNKVKDVSLTDTLLGQSLEKLNSRKEVIEEEVNSNHIKYYASHAGIILYSIDGYEETYVPKDFENYTYDKLNMGSSVTKGKIKETKTTIDVGEPIYKIIDNFEWYIAIKIEDGKKIKEFENNQTLLFEMKGDKQELKGKIVSINVSGGKGVIVVKLNTMLHNYYDIRFPELDIIKYKIEGLKIPIKAIIDKDSLKGVYIKNASGIVRFRPINILGQDEKYAYVDRGDNSSYIKLEGEENLTKTITLFDEMFLNTGNIKEGQILN